MLMIFIFEPLTSCLYERGRPETKERELHYLGMLHTPLVEERYLKLPA